MDLSFLFACFVVFITQQPNLVNGLKCYVCSSVTPEGRNSGGPCFEPVEGKTKVKDNCDSCYLMIQNRTGLPRVRRDCFHGPQKPPINETCENPGPVNKMHSCVCNNADLCNKVAIPKPPGIFDCYKCRGEAAQGDDCYKVDENTEVHYDARQCYLDINKGGKFVSRDYDLFSIQPDGWKNDSEEFAKYYCHGTLCNNLEVELPKQTSTSTGVQTVTVSTSNEVQTVTAFCSSNVISNFFILLFHLILSFMAMTVV